MEDLTPRLLGARLARLRAQLSQTRGEELTQRQLAHALGVKPQAYNSWEQGKTLPRLDHLWRLAWFYRISLDMLCGYQRAADTTSGVGWESVRRPQSVQDEEALDLFQRALAGEVEDVDEGRVGLALRHVIASQLIRITHAPPADEALGHALQQRFNAGGKKRLKDVRVIPMAPGSVEQLRALVVGVAAKEYLLVHLDGTPSIGLAPGYAVSCMVRAMYREDPIKPFSVYPLVALPVVDRPDIDANTLIGELLYKYADQGVRGLALQCPGFSLTSDRLEHDHTVREVLTRATCVDIAFIGIGSIEGPVRYFDRGIMNILDMTGISVESLKERGIVGDLCFHLLDAAGNPQEKSLSAGLSAVSLETLQHLVSIGQRVVVLASNELKAAPIYSALRGGKSGRSYINVLIIDTPVAQRLLDMADTYEHDAAMRLV
jgi:DNA-binding transcriptional regulator LsrR (DeoR family)/DNA-binding XRE family transcriptional regulator